MQIEKLHLLVMQKGFKSQFKFKMNVNKFQNRSQDFDFDNTKRCQKNSLMTMSNIC